MKLEDPENYIEAEEDIEMTDFGIDAGKVMPLLYKKIYADPKRAIVQEYLSNARDANREAGRANIPVRMRFPGGGDSDMVISDDGIGINPDRMRNVFTHFGKSTKTGSNSQTGGFGLGCKSAFAVTDSFQVETVWEDSEGQRWQAAYLMAIGAESKNQWTTLYTRKVPSTEPTGTSIRIPIDQDEAEEYCNAAEDVTYYWGHPLVKNSVFPVILHYRTGSPILAPDFEKVREGDKYSADEASRKRPGVILDGIQYALRSERMLAHGLDNRHFHLVRNCALFFSIGELMVTATREDLDYSSANTIHNLRTEIQAFASGYIDFVKESLKGKGFWESVEIVSSRISAFGDLFSRELSLLNWEADDGKVYPLSENIRREISDGRLSTLQSGPLRNASTVRPDGFTAAPSWVSNINLQEVIWGNYYSKGFSLQSRSMKMLGMYRTKPVIIVVDKANAAAHIRGIEASVNTKKIDNFIILTPHQFSPIRHEREILAGVNAPTVEAIKKWVTQDLMLPLEVIPISSFPRVAAPEGYKRVKIEKKADNPYPELRKAHFQIHRQRHASDADWYSNQITEGPKAAGGVYAFFKDQKAYRDFECEDEISVEELVCPTANGDGRGERNLIVWLIPVAQFKKRKKKATDPDETINLHKLDLIKNNPRWISFDRWQEIKEERLIRNFKTFQAVSNLGWYSSSYRFCASDLASFYFADYRSGFKSILVAFREGWGRRENTSEREDPANMPRGNKIKSKSFPARMKPGKKNLSVYRRNFREAQSFMESKSIGAAYRTFRREALDITQTIRSSTILFKYLDTNGLKDTSFVKTLRNLIAKSVKP